MPRDRLRAFSPALVRSWPGRLLVAGAAAKILLLPFVTSGGSPLAWLDAAASLALAVGLGVLLLRSTAWIRQRLLWRVRSKLILFYVFIGFVPVMLVVAFFAVAGAMSGLSASAEVVRRELDRVVADVRVAASAAGARVSSGAGAAAALEPLAATIRAGHPEASALVIGGAPGHVAAAVGPWRSGPRPDSVPAWVPRQGFAGLVTAGPAWPLSIRAIVPVDRPGGGAVVIDVPLDAAVETPP